MSVRASATLVKVKVVTWIDAHPRTGWYIAIIVTLNFVLELVQIVH